jgi:hypothetical protein
MKTRHLFLSFMLFFSVFSYAAELPGGLTRTSEAMANNTYEFVLGPGYSFSPNGAYLSSEIRYQANEDFGAGFGFGAGESGFNFGLNGSWYVFPDLHNQPAFSVLGGIYFNRLDQANYFVVKVAPMVSKTFKMSWGKVTPYAGVHLAPSFRLSQPDNTVALKSTFGSEFAISDLSGVKLFTEFNLGISNSPHSISVALAYPFVAL